MKCPKCSGSLLKETFYPPRTQSALDKFEGWKCFNCGTIIDSVILENKISSPPMILSWSHNPDEISILVNSKRYTYELPLYWIEKVERMWKHSAWKAFDVVKKQGRLRRSCAAHHRPKGG